MHNDDAIDANDTFTYSTTQKNTLKQLQKDDFKERSKIKGGLLQFVLKYYFSLTEVRGGNLARNSIQLRARKSTRNRKWHYLSLCRIQVITDRYRKPLVSRILQAVSCKRKSELGMDMDTPWFQKLLQ